MLLSGTNTLLVITATTTALIAGLFYAWSCSVLPGIGKLPDAAYMAAFQSMNRAILNPVFFLSFLGTMILLPVTTYVHYSQAVSMRFWFLLAATIVYAIGFAITMFGNVPLNESLDAFNLQSASQEAIAAQRIKFDGPWNKLHTLRTITSVLAIILVIIACLSPHTEAQTKDL